MLGEATSMTVHLGAAKAPSMRELRQIPEPADDMRADFSEAWLHPK